jgi:hypothetical protein
LLGTQVNLSTNKQAEFFIGVSDSDLAWVQNLGPHNPATNIMMISGEWDDILTPEAASFLAEKLSSKSISPNSGVEYFEDSNRRDFILLPRLLHNYEPFSPRVLANAKIWAATALNVPITTAEAAMASNRIGYWIIGLTGLFIGLIGAAVWQKSSSPIDEASSAKIQITRLGRIVGWRLFLLVDWAANF